MRSRLPGKQTYLQNTNIVDTQEPNSSTKALRAHRAALAVVTGETRVALHIAVVPALANEGPHDGKIRQARVSFV